MTDEPYGPDEELAKAFHNDPRFRDALNGIGWFSEADMRPVARAAAEVAMDHFRTVIHRLVES